MRKHTLHMPESLLANPSRFTRSIAETAEYRRNRQHEVDETGALRRAVALGSRALVDSHTTEHGYVSPEGCVYRLIATIDDFVTAQQELDHLKEEDAERRQKLPHLRKAIAFNHAAKELINNQPNIEFNELVAFTTKMYLGMHRDDPDLSDEHRYHQRALYVRDATKQRLHGMRSELAMEQIIWAANDPAIEYEETTIEDELRGVDLFITYHGQRVGIDAKASRAAAQMAKAKSSHPERIVWSQVKWDDFDGGFRISDELAARKVPDLLAELRSAAQAA